eukprot:g59.t1
MSHNATSILQSRLRKTTEKLLDLERQLLEGSGGVGTPAGTFSRPGVLSDENRSMTSSKNMSANDLISSRRSARSFTQSFGKTSMLPPPPRPPKGITVESDLHFEDSIEEVRAPSPAIGIDSLDEDGILAQQDDDAALWKKKFGGDSTSSNSNTQSSIVWNALNGFASTRSSRRTSARRTPNVTGGSVGFDGNDTDVVRKSVTGRIIRTLHAELAEKDRQLRNAREEVVEADKRIAEAQELASRKTSEIHRQKIEAERSERELEALQAENQRVARRLWIEQQSLTLEADYCASLQNEWRSARHEATTVQLRTDQLKHESQLCAELNARCDGMRDAAADADEEIRRVQSRASASDALAKELRLELNAACEAAARNEADLQLETEAVRRATQDVHEISAASDLERHEHDAFRSRFEVEMRGIEVLAGRETEAAERRMSDLERTMASREATITKLEMRAELLESERDRAEELRASAVAEVTAHSEAKNQDHISEERRLRKFASNAESEVEGLRSKMMGQNHALSESKMTCVRLRAEIDVLSAENDKCRTSLHEHYADFKREVVAMARAQTEEVRWREIAGRYEDEMESAGRRKVEELNRSHAATIAEMSEALRRSEEKGQIVEAMQKELMLTESQYEKHVEHLRNEIEETLEANTNLYEDLVRERGGGGVPLNDDDVDDDSSSFEERTADDAETNSPRRPLHLHISRRGSVDIVGGKRRQRTRRENSERRRLGSNESAGDLSIVRLRREIVDAEDRTRARMDEKFRSEMSEIESRIENVDRDQTKMHIEISEVEDRIAREHATRLRQSVSKIEADCEIKARERRESDEMMYHQRLGSFTRAEHQVIARLHSEIDEGTDRAEASCTELIALRERMVRVEEHASKQLADVNVRTRHQIESLKERHAASVDNAVAAWAREHARETEDAWERQENAVRLQLRRVRWDLQTIKTELERETEAAAEGHVAMEELDVARRQHARLESTVEEFEATSRLTVVECEDEVMAERFKLSARLEQEESALRNRLGDTEERVAAVFVERQREALRDVEALRHRLENATNDAIRAECELEVVRSNANDARKESSELRDALERSNASMTNYEIEIQDEQRLREEQIAKRAARLVLSEKRALDELRTSRETAAEVDGLRRELVQAQNERARLEKERIERREIDTQCAARRLAITMLQISRQVVLRALLRWKCNAQCSGEDMLERYKRRLRRQNRAMQQLRKKLELAKSGRRDDRDFKSADEENATSDRDRMHSSKWERPLEEDGEGPLEIDVQREEGVDPRFLWEHVVNDDAAKNHTRDRGGSERHSGEVRRVSLSTIRRLRDLSTYEVGKASRTTRRVVANEVQKNSRARRLGRERDVTVKRPVTSDRPNEGDNEHVMTRRRADHARWDKKSSRRRGTYFGTYASKRDATVDRDTWQRGAIRALRRAIEKRRTLFGRRLELSRLNDAFDVMDTSSDGFVDERELAAVLRRLDIVLTEKQHRKLFEHIDRNDDGHIEISEFRGYKELMSVGARRCLDDCQRLDDLCVGEGTSLLVADKPESRSKPQGRTTMSTITAPNPQRSRGQIMLLPPNPAWVRPHHSAAMLSNGVNTYVMAENSFELDAHIAKRVSARRAEETQCRAEAARTFDTKSETPTKLQTANIMVTETSKSRLSAKTSTLDREVPRDNASRRKRHSPPPAMDLEDSTADSIRNWTIENGFGDYFESLIENAGIRSLRDVADYMCSRRVVQDCFPDMPNADRDKFVAAASALRRKISLDNVDTPVELAGHATAHVGDFVFFPNTKYEIARDEVRSLKWWPKYWVARVVNTDWGRETGMCRLRLYVTTSDNMEGSKAMGRGVFYRATNHLFSKMGRQMLGPINLREIDSIHAWELLDCLDFDGNFETWSPQKRNVSVPSFETCVSTLARHAKTTVQFRFLVESERNDGTDEEENDANLVKDLPIALSMCMDFTNECTVAVQSLRRRTRRQSFDAKFIWTASLDSTVLSPPNLYDVTLHAVVSAEFVHGLEHSEDWTLETLARVMDETILLPEKRRAFSSIAKVRLAATMPVEIIDTESIDDAIGENQSGDDFVFDYHPIGSFVYFPNPDFLNPENGMIHSGDEECDLKAPFLVGRVVSNDHGTYKLRIYDRIDAQRDAYAPRETLPKFASAFELSLKPLLDVTCDLEGLWHCNTDMSPLALPLPGAFLETDAVIRKEAASRSFPLVLGDEVVPRSTMGFAAKT